MFPRSLRRRLLVVVFLTTLVALVVALAAIVGYNLRVYYLDLSADMTTQAELLGHMTAPALTFDDKRLANQNLNLLRLRPMVRAAAIYNARGAPFAEYFSETAAEHSIPKLAETDAVRIEGRDLILWKRIVSDGEIVGTVYLRANYELVGRLLDYLGIAAAAAAFAMVVAFLMSLRLQRSVTDPILAIAGIAREFVQQRDYSRRATKVNDDEVGVLVESFNDMLSEIERRTLALERSSLDLGREVEERNRAQAEIMRLNSDLEVRVGERTAQLEATNQELALAKSAAEQSDQAKSAFLSSMSHELRTPLNAILGFGQILASDAFPTTAEQKKEFITHILEAGDHLLELINEVLDLAKVESGTLTLSMEPVELAEVMHESQAMIVPLANARNIRMVFPQNDTLQVIGDRIRTKQVLLNLMSNAVKYNREGGTVIVGCAPVANDRVRISVQDTGEGLDATQLTQLFQPFNRLGQEAGAEVGTGIGLVVTKRLVELMGGAIGASSTVGVGSLFWIELQASNRAAPAQVDDVAQRVGCEWPSPPGAAVRRLLYVEDNPANLRLVQEIVAFRPDLSLSTATNGNAGVEMARAHRPDVILMDINLPGISGIEALRILRDDMRTAHIPVIALTANAMHRDVKRNIAYGFFRYLTKPINVEAFFEALDAALEVSDNRTPQD